MGTTVQKFDYAFDTKDLLKDNINKINNVLDDNSTFRSYPQELFNGYLDILNNGTDTLWNNLEKVSQTGTEAVLEGVETAPMKMVLNGNTSQETTSGKNLLEYTLTSLKNINLKGTWSGNVYTFGDVIYTVNDDLTINVNAPSTHSNSYLCINNSLSLVNGTEYILNGSPTGGAANKYGIRLYTGTSYISDIGGGITFIYDTQNIVRVNVFANIEVNNLIFKPMIRLSSVTDGTYEKYTGGQPSPSPDYPQEVKIVKGENVVSVSGKNLFNAFIAKKILAQNGTIDVASDGTISLSGNNSANGYFKLDNSIKELCPSLKAGDVVFLFLDTDWEVRKYIYTPTMGSWLNGQSKTMTEEILNEKLIIYGGYQTTSHITIMVTKEVDNVYVPYSKTDYPISLGTIEMCKINTYKDFPFKAINGNEYYDTLTAEQKNALNYGSWYVHKEIGKKIFDGSENWSAIGTQTSGYSRFANSSLQGVILPPSSNDEAVLACCNAFEAISANDTYRRHIGISCRTSGNYIDIYYDQLAEGTAEDFKTWLSNNNVTLYYVLATPTNTEITNTTLIEQLEAIANAKSVKDKTYITQTNDELPFILDVEAIKEYERA